ncbi:unnamed protein product [Rotaria magnacalcarata]|uniref:Uncharacterized protein n=1 Tax=Rotaria magnacalcarata TaxID=392030 RepID=A0A816M7C6_9BILA|nr:unnamed protein product [Rotaria magnacalcarata]
MIQEDCGYIELPWRKLRHIRRDQFLSRLVTDLPSTVPILAFYSSSKLPYPTVDPFMSGNLGFFLHLNNSGGFTIAKENKLITIDHQSSVSKDSTETIEKQSASDDESTVTSSASNAQVVKNLTYSLTQEIFIVHQ